MKDHAEAVLDGQADDGRRDYFGGLTVTEWVEQNRQRRAMVAHRRSEAARKGWETRRRRQAAFDPAVAAAQTEAAKQDGRELAEKLYGTGERCAECGQPLTGKQGRCVCLVPSPPRF